MDVEKYPICLRTGYLVEVSSPAKLTRGLTAAMGALTIEPVDLCKSLAGGTPSAL